MDRAKTIKVFINDLSFDLHILITDNYIRLLNTNQIIYRSDFLASEVVLIEELIKSFEYNATACLKNKNVTFPLWIQAESKEWGRYITALRNQDIEKIPNGVMAIEEDVVDVLCRVCKERIFTVKLTKQCYECFDKLNKDHKEMDSFDRAWIKAVRDNIITGETFKKVADECECPSWKTCDACPNLEENLMDEPNNTQDKKDIDQIIKELTYFSERYELTYTYIKDMKTLYEKNPVLAEFDYPKNLATLKQIKKEIITRLDLLEENL